MKTPNSENLEFYIKKAEDLISSGAYEEAIESYNEALKIDPENARALYAKGYALFQLDKYQEVLDVFDEELKIDPKNIDKLCSKGEILSNKLGKHEEAIESYNEALKIDSKNALALYFKRNALNKLGKYEGANAIETYNKKIFEKFDKIRRFLRLK